MKAPVLTFDPNRPKAGPSSVGPTVRVALSLDERRLIDMYRLLHPQAQATYRDWFKGWIICWGPHGTGGASGIYPVERPGGAA
jgi:hypothetical protein